MSYIIIFTKKKRDVATSQREGTHQKLLDTLKSMPNLGCLKHPKATSWHFEKRTAATFTSRFTRLTRLTRSQGGLGQVPVLLLELHELLSSAEIVGIVGTGNGGKAFEKETQLYQHTSTRLTIN